MSVRSGGSVREWRSRLPQKFGDRLKGGRSPDGLEHALESAFARSLQPLAAAITALRQQVDGLEQETQQLKTMSQSLPLTLTDTLHHFLQQLQATLSSKHASDARESLQQQLQHLIDALTTIPHALHPTPHTLCQTALSTVVAAIQPGDTGT